MATGTMVGRDCYYRVTDAKGRGSIRCTRVWSDTFLVNLSEEGAKAEKPEDRFTVKSATEEEYRAEHWKKKH